MKPPVEATPKARYGRGKGPPKAVSSKRRAGSRRKTSLTFESPFFDRLSVVFVKESDEPNGPTGESDAGWGAVKMLHLLSYATFLIVTLFLMVKGLLGLL